MSQAQTMQAPMDQALHFEVSQLFFREGWLLDNKRWAEWIELYAPQAEYWVPAWANETECTGDPGRELSLIYCRDRGGLEDRVFRIEAEDSFAAMPLDRTVHVTSNILLHGEKDGLIEASSSWVTHVYGIYGGFTIAGLSDYSLRRAGGELKIARKRTVLIDDKLEYAVDVYHL